MTRVAPQMSLLIAVFLSACGGEKQTPALPGSDAAQTQSLEGEGWRYLWDPASRSLKEWQILGKPRNLIEGPWGELILADSQNARVVRFDRTGELIEIIGRRGDGPGEFQGPTDLDWHPSENVLWVAERTHERYSISRFELDERTSKFIDRFRVPEMRQAEMWPSLAPGPRYTWDHPSPASIRNPVAANSKQGPVFYATDRDNGRVIEFQVRQGVPGGS